MLNDLKVKVGPQFYEYHEDAIEKVPDVLEEYEAKKILIVHGTVSWEKAKTYLSFVERAKYAFTYHQYSGECSYYSADRIVELSKAADIDFIIGVGGGKLADLVGYAAHLLDLDFGLIPTLASNCAPWTPLSVMYKESGEAEGKTEHYLRQAAFLITDPRLVIDAPVDYFIAGLADTLAKWYESDAILQQEHLRNEPFLQLAAFTAKLCKEAIMQDSVKAIEDMKQGVLSEEFVHLSEIIFAVAGMVGGLGDKYARNAAAHAMHDGMSKYIPESHPFLHGEKVAYGIFYQLALEEKWHLIDQLLPFYQALELPVSLQQMGIHPEESVIDEIIEFIDSKEKVHLIPVTTTRSSLKNALLSLEEYIKEKRE
ncbi:MULTISPECIES: iron-containing alcohol dehydrogenase family protein [unclassified Enterococcus]|uniref:iron-containing alcohol dehydrogenase family protein n=1 Tax=unclassified Enterococcus TaxID=2608891 RepID=UPI001CE097BC|nr:MULTISPECIES: iron-containing alcohol dehydrogenase family protein [unclassified Enterococcus]MCA5012113.1 iron-containing alcohol dehydrogenase family protein [Enterococcus sp. S23]MCA5015364.1 iron-containing alcohol dehydrogenase family protein [Enterococcus sp. S22(2020)]